MAEFLSQRDMRSLVQLTALQLIATKDFGEHHQIRPASLTNHLSHLPNLCFIWSVSHRRTVFEARMTSIWTPGISCIGSMEINVTMDLTGSVELCSWTDVSDGPQCIEGMRR